MWQTIQKSLESSLDAGLRWSNFSEFIGFSLFLGLMYAIVMAYTRSASSLNRISSYVMIIPRQLALDNQYLRHFLRRFL